LTFYTFGGVPRRFSPLNIDATYRPRKTVFVNTRTDYGVGGDGIRDFSATVGYDTKLLKIFQTFLLHARRNSCAFASAVYQRRRRRSRKRCAVRSGVRRFFAGDREKGFYGGASLFFDFENRRACDFRRLSARLHGGLRFRLLRRYSPILHIQRRRSAGKPFRFQF
jgi:hypothetical protein